MSISEYTAGGYNWLALVWPAALVIFVIFFFRACRKDMFAPRGSKTPLMGPPARMTKRDWLAALALTFVFGVLSFTFSGSAVSPQTFWRAAKERPFITLDLGEEVRLDNILYYTGLDNRVEGSWILELSADGSEWRRQPSMEQEFLAIFNWKIPLLEPGGPLPVRYIRIIANAKTGDFIRSNPHDRWLELGELVLFVRDENGERALFDAAPLAERYPEYAALFDEQLMAPAMPDADNNTLFKEYSAAGLLPDRKDNGAIFDEVLYARAAYEYTRGLEPEEITHPPLGKLIIALGIKMFGMTPFGWRFMCIIFGALMIPALYVFIKNLFGSTLIAFCGAAMLAFESMHYSQTRIAVIDAFIVFFILAMYLFMYRYISSGYDAPFKKTLPPLFLCGLSFGLGAATKWIAFYAALGLIALYAAYLAGRGRRQIAAGRRREFRSFLRKTLAASVVFFVALPAVIYVLSYIPYSLALNPSLTLGGLFRDMWDNQKYMLYYHGNYMTEFPHEFQAGWWQWLLDVRPITYYRWIQDGGRAVISAFTNPLVTIGGLAAMGVTLYDCVRKKSGAAFVISAGYLAQLLPWILVARSTFSYHYFPSLVFLILAICYVFNNLLTKNPKYKKRALIFTGVSVGLFFLLLPPAAGIQMPDWYSAWFARWLPTWLF